MKLFSRRHAPPPTDLRYDVPDSVRSRIVAIIEHHVRGKARQIFLDRLEDLLLRQYGGLARPGYEAARSSVIPVIEHFFSCDEDLALDFIEACFRLDIGIGGQDAVNEINQVFRQEGVGYELTRYLAEPQVPGHIFIGQPVSDDQLPQIIRIDNQHIHREVVGPALSLLSNPVFRIANTEMLKAHTDRRAGRLEDAITACGSAFESVLKTICDRKGWAFDPDRATCPTLVDICHKQGLFQEFYLELFKRVGTIRNKLGDAHGRGPTPAHDVEGAHAEHMLHMTSAHIILLCKLAELE